MALVHRHPTHPRALALGQLGQQGRLAVTGRGDHTHHRHRIRGQQPNHQSDPGHDPRPARDRVRSGSTSSKTDPIDDGRSPAGVAATCPTRVLSQPMRLAPRKSCHSSGGSCGCCVRPWRAGRQDREPRPSSPMECPRSGRDRRRRRRGPHWQMHTLDGSSRLPPHHPKRMNRDVQARYGRGARRLVAADHPQSSPRQVRSRGELIGGRTPRVLLWPGRRTLRR